MEIGGDQASSPRPKIALPDRIEAALDEIYKKHNRRLLNEETRQRLSSIPEDSACDSLGRIINFQGIKSLNRLIKSLIRPYAYDADQPSSSHPSSSPSLPIRIEAALEEIYRKHNPRRINGETRQRLSSISEELACSMLMRALKKKRIRSLDRLIKFLVDRQRTSGAVSPAQSP